jgi:hypothetical protein
MCEQVVVVSPDGRIQFLWADELSGLIDDGRTVIRRASHVEPTADGRWTADLAPSGGPVLGPFRLRGQAIDAEREWLKEHHFIGAAQ